MKQCGGTKRIAQEICESMNLHLTSTIEKASQQVIDNLPKSQLGWTKLILKDKWIHAKNLVKGQADKLKKYIKNKFNLSNTTNKTSSAIETPKPKISKKIPNEYKPLLANLDGKIGQEFVDTAYGNMVSHMKLNGIAPKNIVIKGNDGIMTIIGGYDPINNTIQYSQGFLSKLQAQEQINLISHELKHCEQISNILRTENIGVREYARGIAENNLKQALDKSSFEFMLKNKYEQALKQGKGEEFIQKTIDNWTEEFIHKIETGFSEVLKLPKIKATSPEGIKAAQDFEAMKNYEGLDAFGFGSSNYTNHPLEVEAYTFGDNIENIFKSFIS